MIGSKYKAFFDEKLNGLAKAVIKTGVTPNQLTLIGLIFGFLSCVFLIVTKRVLIFCVLMVLSGLLDALDGLVARLTGRCSKFGAYLDAMCDRYYEAAAVLSVAYVTGYWLLSFLAITGAMITSYAKARAGMEVPVSNTEWPDFMERMERCVIFVTGLFLSRIFPWRFFGHDLFFWTLALIAAGTHFTAGQRILRAKKIIENREN